MLSVKCKTLNKVQTQKKTTMNVLLILGCKVILTIIGIKKESGAGKMKRCGDRLKAGYPCN